MDMNDKVRYVLSQNLNAWIIHIWVEEKFEGEVQKG